MDHKKNNKLFLLFLSLLLVGALLSGCAKTNQASTDPQMPNEGVFFKLITLGYLVDYNIISAPINPLEGFIRLLLAILLFALLFKGAEWLKLGMNISIVIAMVITLITIIFVPSSILVAAATTYGAIFSVIIAGAPIVGCFAAYWFLRAHLFLRTIVMGVVWWVVVEMVNVLKGYAAGFTTNSTVIAATSTALGYNIPATQSLGGVVGQVTTWLGYVEYVVAILFIINLGMAVAEWSKNFKAGKVTPGDAWRWSKNQYHDAAHWRDSSVMREYVDDRAELDHLDKVLVATDTAIAAVQAATSSRVLEYAGSKDIVQSWERLKKGTEDIRKEFRRVKGRTWREERGYAKIRKKLADAGKDVTQLDVLEGQLLAKHKEVIDQATAALGTLSGGDAHIKRLKGLSKGFFPVDLRAPSPGGWVRGSLGSILTMLTGFKAAMENAKQAQKDAVNEVTGILAEMKDVRRT